MTIHVRSSFDTSRWKKYTACMLQALLLILLLTPSSASAGLRTCRADPIVTLSNSRVVQMTTQLAADPGNVTMITYHLHVPAGVTVRNIAYTGGALAGKEKVFVYDDLEAGSYTTDTVVEVRGKRVDVQATSLAGGEKKVVEGRSGERLRARFELPW